MYRSIVGIHSCPLREPGDKKIYLIMLFSFWVSLSCVITYNMFVKVWGYGQQVYTSGRCTGGGWWESLKAKPNERSSGPFPGHGIYQLKHICKKHVKQVVLK